MKWKPYQRTAFYYETDQMGMIHHSNYIRWFEEARIDLMKQMGLSYKKMEEMGIRIPVLKVSCDYKRSVLYDETVLIETEITKYNGLILLAEYQMKDKVTLGLMASGKSKHCFLDQQGKPIRLNRQFPQISQIFSEALDHRSREI